MQLRDYQLKAIRDVSLAWRAGYQRPCIVLPCGGGKSIITADMAKRVTDSDNRVLFLVHRRELCEQIENTFHGYGVNPELCNVMMVQTASRRLDRLQRPKLIITDENHHCLANSYKRIYQHFSDCYCVGVTATPVRLNGGGLGEINDKLIIGPTVRELIDRNCLADFDCYAPQVADLSGLKRKSTGDFDMTQAAEMLSRPAIYGDIIRHYHKLADGVKAICYCPTIEHSMQVAERFREAGIPAAHIDGDTPKQERAQIVQDFRDGRVQILCNVDLISEGFDVPDCGCSILLRPTKSLTLYTQQAMRSMRYQPNKRAVIIDHVGNVHRFGLPDAEREWSLDPKPQKKQEKTIAVKQCPVCFYTHAPVRRPLPKALGGSSPAQALRCPKCGHVYQKTERELMEEKKEQELMKIESRVQMMQRPSECKSMKELAVYAKQHGYKPGWAWHQAKALGIFKKGESA